MRIRGGRVERWGLPADPVQGFRGVGSSKRQAEAAPKGAPVGRSGCSGPGLHLLSFSELVCFTCILRLAGSQGTVPEATLHSSIQPHNEQGCAAKATLHAHCLLRGLGRYSRAQRLVRARCAAGYTGRTGRTSARCACGCGTCGFPAWP